MAKKGKVVVDYERCKGCHICLTVCPTASLELDEGHNLKGYKPVKFKAEPAEGEKSCTGCAMCGTVCPEVALEVYRAK